RAAKNCGDGAGVATRRVELWPRRPDAVGPDAALPANAESDAGTRHLGSNAGSNAAADTCSRTLYAGRSVAAAAVVAVVAVVAAWYGGDTSDYHDRCLRERILPREV